MLFRSLKSLVVKAHGSSNARAVKNAVRQCVLFAEADITGKMKEAIAVQTEKADE